MEQELSCGAGVHLGQVPLVRAEKCAPSCATWDSRDTCATRVCFTARHGSNLPGTVTPTVAERHVARLLGKG